MTYAMIAAITNSGGLRPRLFAAAAEEGKTPPVEEWVAERIWLLAATPGWADAWASALVADPNSDPGLNEGVITDGMILAAVQPMS